MAERIVFLTRKIYSYSWLASSLADAGCVLRGFPYVNTVSRPFDNDLTSVQWLFFLSPAAVVHFFDQVKVLPSGLKLAALGEGTASAFPGEFQPDFIGRHSDTAETGKDFARILSSADMFFVRGPKTSGRVQQMIPQEQRNPLICYDTFPVKEKLTFRPEVVVFSSPANAEAFVASNRWVAGMKAVAFGNTTAKALENLSIAPIVISENTDEKSLLEAIIKALDV